MEAQLSPSVTHPTPHGGGKVTVHATGDVVKQHHWVQRITLANI